MMEPISLIIAGASTTAKVAMGGDPTISDVAFAVATGAGTGVGSIGSSAQTAAANANAANTANSGLSIEGLSIKDRYLPIGQERVLSESSKVLADGTQQTTTISQEFVADPKYASIGNLLDICDQVRNGEVPSLDTLIGALVDVLDISTLTLLRPYLLEYKVGSHLQSRLYQRTKVSFESVNISAPEIIEGSSVVDQAGSKGYFQEKSNHLEDKETKKAESLSAIDQESVSGYILDKSATQQLIQNYNGNINEDLLNKLMTSAESCGKKVHAQIHTVSTDTTIREASEKEVAENKIFGWKLGWLVGKNEGETVTRGTIDKTYNIEDQVLDGYELSPNDKITPDIIRGLGGKTIHQDEASKTLDGGSYTKPGEFEEGAISYLPFIGSSLNVAAKLELGASVTKMDVFWVAVDAATAAATLGVSGAGKAAVKVGLKEAGKTGLKILPQGAKKTPEAFISKEAQAAGRQAQKEFEIILSKGKIRVPESPIPLPKEPRFPDGAVYVGKQGGVAPKNSLKEGLEHASGKTKTVDHSSGKLDNSRTVEKSGPGSHAETKAKTVNTNAANPKGGGAYSEVKTEGSHAHHMPSKDASHLSTEKGPAISMGPEDHRRTASYGNSNEARAYREEQRKLIVEGKFKEAQQMDIDDIRSKFGSKYDQQIKEMLEYTKTLQV
jgi:hypothetical protein